MLCLPGLWLRLSMLTLSYFLFLQKYLGIKSSNLLDLFGVKVGMLTDELYLNTYILNLLNSQDHWCSKDNWCSKLLTYYIDISLYLQVCDETLSPSGCVTLEPAVVPGVWLTALNQGRIASLDALALPGAMPFPQCIPPHWCSNASANPYLLPSFKNSACMAQMPWKPR